MPTAELPPRGSIEFSYLVARGGESFWYTAQRTYDEAKALADGWGKGAYVVQIVPVEK